MIDTETLSDNARHALDRARRGYASDTWTLTGDRVVAEIVRGRYAIVQAEADVQTPDGRTWTRRVIVTAVDGGAPRSSQGVTGDAKTVTRKLSKSLDEWIANDEIRPRLCSLIGNLSRKEIRPVEEGALAFLSSTPALDSVAWVYAMGYFRRGIVTKTTATHVEVAYTTAASGGVIRRKSAKISDVLA